MKKRNNRGAAMIAVLCIMAIFLTLCLSMLLTSSVLLQNAQNRLYEEQCKISALSMSQELQREIEDSSSSFYGFLQDAIAVDAAAKWPYLNGGELNHGENAPGVVRRFGVSGADPQGAGAVSALMFWEFEHGGDVSDIFLHVEVTAEKNGEKYTIVSIYNPSVAQGETGWNWSLSERS